MGSLPLRQLWLATPLLLLVVGAVNGWHYQQSLITARQNHLGILTGALESTIQRLFAQPEGVTAAALPQLWAQLDQQPPLEGYRAIIKSDGTLLYLDSRAPSLYHEAQLAPLLQQLPAQPLESHEDSFQEGALLYRLRYLPQQQWWVLLYQPSQHLQPLAQQLALEAILLTLGSLLLILLILLLLQRFLVVAPLQQLQQQMEQIIQQQPIPPSPPYAALEFRHLGAGLEQIAARLAQYHAITEQQQVQARVIEEQRAEIESLQVAAQQLHQQQQQLTDQLQQRGEQLQQLQRDDYLLQFGGREGVILGDGYGHCRVINPAALQMLGYTTAEQLIGLSLAALTLNWDKPDPDGGGGGRDALTRALRQSEPLNCDHAYFRHHDGYGLPVSYQLLPIEATAAYSAAYILRFQDRSPCRELEEQRLQGETLFNTTTNGVMISNRNGVIQRVNGRFCAMCGYSAEELVGRRANILSSGRHSRTFYLQLWQTLLQSGSWHGEICNRHKAGYDYWQQVAIYALSTDRDPHRSFIAVIEAVRPITATEPAERERPA